MRHRIVLASAALAVATAAVAAPLSRPAAQAVMKQRHAGFEALGKTMRQTRQAIDQGNVAQVRASANRIAGLAGQAPRWFPAGSGPEAGKTHARAAIWQNRADFDSKMAAFGGAARAFQAAANGGDMAAIKASYGRLGQTCSACHKDYREKHD